MSVVAAEHVALCVPVLAVSGYEVKRGTSSPFALITCQCVAKNTEITRQKRIYCSPVFTAFS